MKTLIDDQCEDVFGGSFIRDLFYTGGYILGAVGAALTPKSEVEVAAMQGLANMP